jgi:sulfur carrier protein
MKIRLNGEPTEVTDGLTVAGLVSELGLQEKQVAVEVNRELVPRGSRGDTRLCEDDEIEMVTMVGGG